MAKVSKKCKNPCPLDKLIGTLAKELGVTKDVARYIYDTMGAVVIELLEEYDTIKVLPMMKHERYDTKPRRIKNLQNGQIKESVQREKIYGNVLSENKRRQGLAMPCLRLINWTRITINVVTENWA